MIYVRFLLLLIYFIIFRIFFRNRLGHFRNIPGYFHLSHKHSILFFSFRTISMIDFPQFYKYFTSFASSNLSKMPLHLWLCKCFSLVGATCGRPRAFTERPYSCGGSNLSTDLLLWGIYIKKCISPVRIRLQTRNARNASTKFRKTLESKK